MKVQYSVRRYSGDSNEVVFFDTIELDVETESEARKHVVRALSDHYPERTMQDGALVEHSYNVKVVK